MATQGRLGRQKDSATATHEELCEAALCCCPKLMILDANKMSLVFICQYLFTWEGAVQNGREVNKDRGKRMEKTDGEGAEMTSKVLSSSGFGK